MNHVELDVADKDGVTGRQHLTHVLRQVPDASVKRELQERLSGPRLTFAERLYLGYFFELNEARQSNGWSPLPVTWTELDAWSRLTQTPLTPFVATALRVMDNTYLHEIFLKHKREHPDG